MKYVTATDAGLISCHACGHLQARAGARSPQAGHQRCARCNSPLHLRHPDSLMRTWALLIAAALLYIPANLLPVMHTASLVGDEDDTIMSGVVYFWTSGDAPLAVIVFIASILVPMLKLSVIALLCITSQRRSTWRPVERSKLYRLVEFIGRWSMLDIFVVTLTVALAGRDRIRLGRDPDDDGVDAVRSAPDLGSGGRRQTSTATTHATHSGSPP
jgi:paraquat-inducible protein A